MQPYKLMSHSKLLFLPPTSDILRHQTGARRLPIHGINPLGYPVSSQAPVPGGEPPQQEGGRCAGAVAVLCVCGRAGDTITLQQRGHSFPCCQSWPIKISV